MCWCADRWCVWCGDQAQTACGSKSWRLIEFGPYGIWMRSSSGTKTRFRVGVVVVVVHAELSTGF